MNWNEDALQAVSKAPALLRGMVKKKVEAHVRQKGRDVVTLADVQEAKNSAMRAPKGDGSDDSAGLSPMEIEKIVNETKTAVTSDSRFYEVKACGGAFGCPRALFDVQALADKMIKRIETSGLPQAVEARVRPPILRHHKFAVAISGCPNSCSQPQIHDFGVQGRARVGYGSGCCTKCMACVRICSEGSIAVDENGPQINHDICINCGDCPKACPVSSLLVEEQGYTVLMGGKLGRHPQLAREIIGFTDETTLLKALNVAIEIFTDDLQKGERMADAVTRIGVQEITKRVGD